MTSLRSSFISLCRCCTHQADSTIGPDRQDTGPEVDPVRAAVSAWSTVSALTGDPSVSGADYWLPHFPVQMAGMPVAEALWVPAPEREVL